MATTETTPNSSRHATQPLNSRSHSVRTAATAALDDAVPPARPVFLDQPLFMNALAGPSRAPPVLGNKSVNGGATSVPMQTTRIDGRQFGDFNKASTNTRKRTLAETTATARENGHSPDESAARQVKRLRAAAGVVPVPGEGAAADVDAVAAATAAAIARRKQRKAERGAGIEKLQQDTQQWRQKYRKAFPSFTFYFDAIDEATQSTLGSAVRKLGAVRHCHSSRSRDLKKADGFVKTVGRQLLLQKGHARRDEPVHPDGNRRVRNWQGERRLGFREQTRGDQLGGRTRKETDRAESEDLRAAERPPHATVSGEPDAYSRQGSCLTRCFSFCPAPMARSTTTRSSTRRTS